MRFLILDHLSDAGTAGKANDDWLAFDKGVAVVADGATGLSDSRLVAYGESDAQWLARMACERMVSARVDQPVRDLVLEIVMEARFETALKHDVDNVPRYAWPAASFIMARLQSGFVEFSGLGDCGAYVAFKDGSLEQFSAMPMDRDLERKSAAADLAANRTSKDAIRSAKVLESLRQKRELLNTQLSGLWTLGLEEEAAGHVFTAAVPVNDIESILLASDGFSALCESYGFLYPQEMTRRARSKGLASLNAEIRNIERVVDPRAERFPRYKQSDDSTAILLEITD